jgi:hypothetical protein
MNVALSLEETYADVVPLRRAGAAAAFVSIMRGCNNMWAGIRGGVVRGGGGSPLGRRPPLRVRMARLAGAGQIKAGGGLGKQRPALPQPPF